MSLLGYFIRYCNTWYELQPFKDDNVILTVKDQCLYKYNDYREWVSGISGWTFKQARTWNNNRGYRAISISGDLLYTSQDG